MEQDQDPGLTNFLPHHMPSDQKDLPPGEGVLQGKSCWHLLGPQAPRHSPNPEHLHHETYRIPPSPGASLVPMDS